MGLRSPSLKKVHNNLGREGRDLLWLFYQSSSVLLFLSCKVTEEALYNKQHGHRSQEIAAFLIWLFSYRNLSNQQLVKYGDHFVTISKRRCSTGPTGFLAFYAMCCCVTYDVSNDPTAVVQEQTFLSSQSQLLKENIVSLTTSWVLALPDKWVLQRHLSVTVNRWFIKHFLTIW